jgi:phosphoribosylformylglycinamidine synthase II
MPRRLPTPPRAWAPECSVVPLLEASARKARSLSNQRGWGFSDAEIRRLQAHFRWLGRDPTDVELAGVAQSWSEHCSYKSSRPSLRRAFARFRKERRVLGTGDAGVVRFEDGYAYALRIESHNHPSAVEPYGGAATGIGGILRDVLAVGAKPIALADPLFFGPLDLPRSDLPKGVRHPRYLFEGVVAGIRDYGNRVGVPTVSGGIYFDPAYTVNPLVNVACLGFLPVQRLRPNAAQHAGDALVLVGGLTGRDGLGGVAFASRELTEESGEESRGAVQLGNPIMKEPLTRACLEAFDAGLVDGVKDLGGGGLASASGELVHAGGFGSRIHLDRVALREARVRPWEIWISESQERMILDVRPKHLERLLAIFRQYDVPATVIGEVTRGDREELLYHDAPVADLELAFRVDPPPIRRPRRARKPPSTSRRLRVPDDEVPGLIESMVLAPDNLSRESILRLYDHEVQGRLVVKPLPGRVTSPTHGDAAVLQPRLESWRGLAVAVAAQPWACREDPRNGAVLAVEELARNLYSVGARPDALTNCLNFGSPEDPSVLGDFDAVVGGLAEAAGALGLVVPSGNVSFYNEGLGRAIPPTPVLMGVGIVEDVRRCVTSDLKAAGNALYLLGTSRPELGGSLYARRAGRHGLPVPLPSPALVRTLGERLRSLGARGLLRACHDVSDGGVGVTLAEMAFGGGLGFEVDLAPLDLPGPGLAAVAEGASRWVLEVDEDDRHALERSCRGLPLVRIGTTTTSGGRVGFAEKELGTLELRGLYDRWRRGVTAG